MQLKGFFPKSFLNGLQVWPQTNKESHAQIQGFPFHIGFRTCSGRVPPLLRSLATNALRSLFRMRESGAGRHSGCGKPGRAVRNSGIWVKSLSFLSCEMGGRVQMGFSLDAQRHTLLKETGVLLTAFDHGHPHPAVLLLWFLWRDNICQPADNKQAEERRDDAPVSHTATGYLVCARQCLGG